MGALFGLLTSLMISSTEFFGRRITNDVGPIVAAACLSLVASITMLVLALGTTGDATVESLLLGAFSGVGFGAGISLYLEGARVSSAAVVAPVSASLATLIPFAYTAVVDARPSAIGLLGAITVVVGLAAVTRDESATSNVGAGLRAGTASGMGYGIGTAILIEASEASGFWPLVSQRSLAFASIATFAVLRGRRLLPPARLVPSIGAAGVFAGFSSVFLLLGLQADALSASVTASLYPAFSVALGRLVFADTVSKPQLAGLVVVLAGIVAVVLG